MKRKLGKTGIEVEPIGLGCMGMSEFYGATDEKQNLETLAWALDNGVDFWDTANIYGNGRNEELLGKALKGRRDQITLATKCGIKRDGDTYNLSLDGSRAHIKAACEKSLKLLQTDVIDLFYLHRLDIMTPTPIEESVAAMAELVQEGKIKHIGLSEISADTLRKANAVHPITALQTEYSLWSLDVEDEILPACRELGVTMVAYSPLGRGFLTGQITKFEDLAEDDFRRNVPRFQGENFEKNLELVREIQKIAAGKDITASQLALAWLLAQGEDVIPIPGTRRIKYLEENMASANVSISADESDRIQDILKGIVGERYQPEGMAIVNV